MKVVCIDTNIKNKISDIRPPRDLNLSLEYGKVYEGELIFNVDGKIEWENNYLNLNGWSEIDWFPTKNFVTLEVWREKILNEIL